MEDFKDRLAEYRIQSWQIEMLIAGGAIFTLYTVDDSFRTTFLKLFPIVLTTSNHIIILFAVYTVSRILILGFTANLILRGVWLAYLGINFSFPKGIKYEKLRSSEAYKDLLKTRPNTVNRIVALERWCNLSYSLAILLALFSASLFISISVVMFVLNFFDLYEIADSTIFAYLLAIFLAVVQLGILDKVLLRKGNTETKGAKWRSKISKVFKYLTLSFLFERELLVLKTNMNRWVLYGFTLFFLFLSIIISSNQIGSYYPWGTLNLTFFDDRENFDVTYKPYMNALRYADDVPDNGYCYLGCIQSEIVKDQHLKLFVVAWVTFDRFLGERFDHHKFVKESTSFETNEEYQAFRVKNDSIYQVVLNELFAVKIDNNLQTGLRWRNYIHPKTKEQGYVSFINIDSLDNGEHDLHLSRHYINNDSITSDPWIQFPFWKE